MPSPSTKYALSDGFDLIASIELKSDSTFTFHWVGCTGPIASATGRYRFDGDDLQLTATSNAFRRDPHTFADVMHRIRWGAREYLVPDARMLAFVNAINGGREPRSDGFGLFYLRAGDEELAVSGAPALGPRWSKFLLGEPLVGNIVGVEKRGANKQRPIVLLDAGSNAGLLEGMRVFVSNPRRPNLQVSLSVVTVEPDRARATAGDVEALVSRRFGELRNCDVWKTVRTAPDAAAADEPRVASCLRERKGDTR
jgi:hypothetical protein